MADVLNICHFRSLRNNNYSPVLQKILARPVFGNNPKKHQNFRFLQKWVARPVSRPSWYSPGPQKVTPQSLGSRTVYDKDCTVDSVQEDSLRIGTVREERAFTLQLDNLKK